MLRNIPDSGIDSPPHTLRSDLPSDGIPILRPSPCASLSIRSNLLQISQSPTACFITSRGQDKMSGVPAPSVNGDLQDEISHPRSAPSDTSDLSSSPNRTESASNTSAETESPGKETMVPKEEEQAMERDHNRQRPPEDVGVPALPSAHEPPVGASFPHRSDPLSNMAPAPSISAPSSNFPSSNMAPAPSISAPPSNFPSSNMAPAPSLSAPLSGLPSSFSNMAPAPSRSAPLSNLPSSMKFFSFVILHVPVDREEAMRVCEILHGLEIGEGTTFCEGFETPGVSPLRCLEDAVENSAYVVLLLTPGFLSKWGEFQTNTVLMNSIDDPNKSGTVIPFIPEFSAPVGKIPLAIRSLIPLHEGSKLFQKQVRNTFKQETIRRQRERWRREQELRALQRSVDDARDLAGDLEMRQRIAMDHQAAYADVYARLSSLMSILPPQLIPGHGPVNIQISNASNIQIGNQNSMSVQEIPRAPTLGTSARGEQDAHAEFMP